MSSRPLRKRKWHSCIGQGPGALVSVFGTARMDQCTTLAASAASTGQNGPSVTVTADANGQAAVDFLSTSIFPFDIQQTTITAMASGTNTATFYITTEGA